MRNPNKPFAEETPEDFTRLPSGEIPPHLGFSKEHVYTNFHILSMTQAQQGGTSPMSLLGSPNVESRAPLAEGDVVMGKVKGLGNFVFGGEGRVLLRCVDEAPSDPAQAMPVGQTGERALILAIGEGNFEIVRRRNGETVEVLHEATGNTIYGDVLHDRMRAREPISMEGAVKCGWSAAVSNLGYTRSPEGYLRSTQSPDVRMEKEQFDPEALRARRPAGEQVLHLPMHPVDCSVRSDSPALEKVEL